MRESLLMRLFRSWTYIKILLFGVGLCLIIWVALAELRLLPRFLTREVQAYFEWETQKGFGTFRIEKPETGQPSTAGDRAWQYLVAIQVKPRLREYFKNLGWQRINGRVSLEVTDFVPVAMPVGLGSDGDVLYDPAETPLMRAADEGNTQTVQSLLVLGANVNAVDQRGQTDLIHACLRGNASPDLIRALLSAGAEVNAKDRNGRTPLLLAAQTPAVSGERGRARRREVLAALLAAHADVNAKNDTGDTALMMAATYSDAESIRDLLLAGADPNARNNRGETALSMAEAKGNTEVVQLLRRPTK